MGSRKEEERNEKIIRGLMKLPPNRRCINCDSLGPQYVCTTFWTFVCTTCSGIHREFTHRVKSVSMAKFTSQEVEALENGGNQRAREMFLNGWDPQTQRFPDNSNAEKIRQFIKNAYVDKKYFAPKSSDKPPKHLQNSRSLDEENRRASSYHSYSQSPPYDFQYEERRYGKHPPGLSRKPGSDRGLYEGKFSSFSSSSQLSDRNFEDRFSPEGSNPRMSDYSASSGVDHFRSSAQSPNYEKDVWSPFSQTSESTSTPSVDLFEHSPNFVAPTFSAHQIVENSAASSLDLFSEMPSKLPSSTDDEVSHGKVIPPNEGWATFDSQMVESVGLLPSSKDNSAGNFEPIIPWSSFEEHVADKRPSSEPSIGQEGSRVVQSISISVSSQWPSLTEFSARGESSSTPNGWNKNQQMIEAAPNKVETQSWNAFEDSTGELNSQSTQTKNEHLETQNRSIVDHNMEFGLPEDFTGELTQTNPVGSLGSSISHFMVPLEDLSMPMAGTFAIDHKPTNPFDLPYDSGLESNDMSQFWDMSSLQANLPDARMPASLSADGLTQPWYNPDPVVPYVSSDPQGALGFMAQSTQIPNVHLQGPVASISGNPFA